MFFGSGFSILILLVYAPAVIAVVVLVVLLARLALAATRTLDTVTEERRLRIDMLAAERGDEIEP